jgi:hypothetical protein
MGSVLMVWLIGFGCLLSLGCGDDWRKPLDDVFKGIPTVG